MIDATTLRALAPFVLGLGIVFAYEGSSRELAGDAMRSPAAPGSPPDLVESEIAPAYAAAPVPGAWSLLPGSCVRFRHRQEHATPWVRAERIRAALQCDVRGLPEQLELVVDMEALRGEERGPTNSELWALLGKGRSSPLRFRARAKETRLLPLPGLCETLFAGSFELAGRTRHEELWLYVVQQPGRMRLIGRRSGLASRFGLPGTRSLWPFGPESEFTVVFDLVFGG